MLPSKARATTEGPLFASSPRPSLRIREVEELAAGPCEAPAGRHPHEHHLTPHDLGSSLWFCRFHFANFLAGTAMCPVSVGQTGNESGAKMSLTPGRSCSFSLYLELTTALHCTEAAILCCAFEGTGGAVAGTRKRRKRFPQRQMVVTRAEGARVSVRSAALGGGCSSHSCRLFRSPAVNQE